MTDRVMSAPNPVSLPEPDPSQPLGSRDNPALLDPMNPEFTGVAHVLYADLRQTCPVARARFRNLGNVEPQTEAERDAAARSPFAAEVWLTTHYDDGVETLLDDDRFSVDPLQALTQEERDALPLVVDGADRIVWIVGHPVAEDFRVTEPSQGVIFLKARRLGGPG